MIQALATNYRRGSQDPGISINQLRFSQSIFYVYGEAARRDSYPRCARSTLGLNCAHVFRASGVQRRAPENKNRGRTSVYRERSVIGLSKEWQAQKTEIEAPRHKENLMCILLAAFCNGANFELDVSKSFTANYWMNIVVLFLEEGLQCPKPKKPEHRRYRRPDEPDYILVH